MLKAISKANGIAGIHTDLWTDWFDVPAGDAFDRVCPVTLAGTPKIQLLSSKPSHRRPNIFQITLHRNSPNDIASCNIRLALPLPPVDLLRTVFQNLLHP
jgi:hypothetical protein